MLVGMGLRLLRTAAEHEDAVDKHPVQEGQRSRSEPVTSAAGS